MDSLTGLLVSGGAPLAAALVFLEQFGLPAPGMPALIVAGALAREGRLSAGELLVASVGLSVLADGFWYGFGMRFGDRAIRLAATLSASPGIVARTESLTRRYGAMLLVIGRFVPPLSMVSVPLAGAAGLPLRTFLLFDVAGAVLWAGGGLAIGAALHRQVEEVLASLSFLDRGFVALTAAFAVYLLWRYLRSRRLAPYLLRRLVPDRILPRPGSRPIPADLVADADTEVFRAAGSATATPRAVTEEPSDRLTAGHRLRPFEPLEHRLRCSARTIGEPGREPR